ncbi:hypothetical protein DMA11_15430 [Marinilabiliaceae bacterium JC017]|nr:hypothetical protein DMA11_15430 [Marinilabiliaceae bacterium JC017]
MKIVNRILGIIKILFGVLLLILVLIIAPDLIELKDCFYPVYAISGYLVGMAIFLSYGLYIIYSGWTHFFCLELKKIFFITGVTLSIIIYVMYAVLIANNGQIRGFNRIFLIILFIEMQDVIRMIKIFKTKKTFPIE